MSFEDSDCDVGTERADALVVGLGVEELLYFENRKRNVANLHLNVDDHNFDERASAPPAEHVEGLLNVHYGRRTRSLFGFTGGIVSLKAVRITFYHMVVKVLSLEEEFVNLLPLPVFLELPF